MKVLNWVVSISAAFMVCIIAGSCYNDKAQLLYPQNVCDSSAAAYAANVVPVLDQYCNSCHGGAAGAGGGIVLDNYPDVKTYVDNGKLMGCITHATGYSQMPKGGSILDDCNIGKLKHWVSARAPNN